MIRSVAFFYSIFLLFFSSYWSDLCAQNLKFDSTFNKTGKLVYEGNTIMDIALLEDGRIVAAHIMENSRGRLYRINIDGSIDNTFNNGQGMADPGYTNITTYTRVTRLPDNSIVYMCQYNSSTIGLTRFDANGTMDTQFGTNGKTVFQIQQGETRPMDIVALPENKILIAGIYRVVSDKWRIFLKQYLSNGLPDNSFGIKGEVIIPESDIEDVVGGIERLSDGKIVLAGAAYMNDLQRRVLQIIRLNPNGSFDGNFGFSGRSLLDLNLEPDDQIQMRDILIEPDSKLTLNGYVLSPLGTRNPFCLRLNPDCSPDISFEGNNHLDLSSVVGLVGIPNILFAEGNKYFICGTRTSSPREMQLMRLNPDGTTDNTFNDNGAMNLGSGEGASTTRMIKSPEGYVYISGIIPKSPSGNKSVIYRLKATPKYSQTIVWEDPHQLDCGLSKVKLKAKSSSGLPVSYNVLSGPGIVPSGSDTLVITGLGDIVISATQPGNDIYAPSAPATLTVPVTRGPFCDIRIYDFVTPNNDGDNDFFYIENLSYYPQHQLEIFDRWGERLYSSSSYDNSWNGAHLSEGIYYYTFQVKGNYEKRYKGTLLIER